MKNGFTLIELLVVLSIVAILAALVFSISQKASPELGSDGFEIGSRAVSSFTTDDNSTTYTGSFLDQFGRVRRFKLASRELYNELQDLPPEQRVRLHWERRFGTTVVDNVELLGPQEAEIQR